MPPRGRASTPPGLVDTVGLNATVPVVRPHPGLGAGHHERALAVRELTRAVLGQGPEVLLGVEVTAAPMLHLLVVALALAGFVLAAAAGLVPAALAVLAGLTIALVGSAGRLDALAA